ncbi:DUF6265 family protein [Sphingobium boeckii]|uniref:DUF6265 domain-containing protein n=1 Tax=Sphingobium boeckii TaxID=1082345 RepID=A0A7W9EE12_9SPHN|nr:DUF6265 family protein [Sphingobium boeckii]MBB5685504.1 hypothetical protein [Sphingobium boeckii]
MKRLAAGFLLMLMGASEPHFAAAPVAMEGAATAETLGWMSGDWVVLDKDGRWTEEIWSAPRAGMMIGTSRTGAGGEIGSFEYMRIAAGEDGALNFFASPNGAAPVVFVLTSWGEKTATFENAANDYPKRINYMRKGLMLVAEISGDKDQPVMRWAYEKR